uniref:piggyBac transposable element-derived protein 4-like n=1 Tax=Myxine glutinosa TaxID=7769 RepID=UPI00358EDC05
MVDMEDILDIDEESECSEPDNLSYDLDADTVRLPPQNLSTTSTSEDWMLEDWELLECCTSEDSHSDCSEKEPGDNAQGNIRTGCNGTCWSENPPTEKETPSRNVLREQSGPANGITTRSPKDAWDLFVSDNMLEEICKCSNFEGRRTATLKKKVWKNISKNELVAFFGICLLAGYEKSWDVSIRELFGNSLSNPLYRATMSIIRFEAIRRFLRFDDKRTREFRMQKEQMAEFRYIWDLFIVNCRKRFAPSECVTVDEQLVPFKGRCRFNQYMPSKPAKYGIKIFWLCDSKTYYAVNGIPYTGKQPGQETQRNVGFHIVQQLCSQLRGTGRNITMDNYFTSVPLAEALIEKGLSLVGTLRLNKKDIPDHMKPSKNRELFSAEFGFKQDITMVSYVPRKGKAVVLLSTMHHDKSVQEESKKKKPDIITYYNSTKGGVDLMDKMVRTYSCKRQTRRWPMVMWYNVMDVAHLNAYVLFTSQHPEFHPGANYKRRLFLKELVQEMVTPHMRSRLQENSKLQKTIVASIDICMEILGQQSQIASRQEQGPQKRKRCCYCPSKIDRKISMTCKKCEKHVCKEHSCVVCLECFQ